MIFFLKPSPATVRAFLERQKSVEFSYRELGCTRGIAPAGWYCDRYRALLGVGAKAFSDACRALSAWTMFDLGWVEAHPDAADIATGTNVAVLIRAAGVWWLNGARIVYVHDSTIDDRQFGFAYGTLSDHAECGEERFWIVRDRDDQVWFELTGHVAAEQVVRTRGVAAGAQATAPLCRRCAARHATCGGRLMVTVAAFTPHGPLPGASFGRQSAP